MTLKTPLTGMLMKADRAVLIAAFVCSMLPSPFQVLLYLSFFLFLAYFFVVPGKKTLVAGKWDLALAVFLLSCLINVFFAEYKISALEGCGVFLVYVLVYFYFKNIPMDSSLHGKIVNAVAVSLLLVCGFALVHNFIIRETLSIPLPWGGYYTLNVFWRDDPGRPIISILQHQMMGGNMIAILAGFVMTFLLVRFRELKVLRRIFLLLVLAVAVAVLAFTYARGAYLFLAVSLVVLAILTRKYWLLVFPLVMALVIVFLPGEKIKQTLKDPMNSQNIPGRFLQYRASMEIFPKSNWLLGIGLINFRFYYVSGYSQDKDYEGHNGGPVVTNSIRKLGPWEEPVIGVMPVPYVHDVYLSMLVETGLIGFISIIGFLVAVFLSSLAHYRRFQDIASLQALVMIPGFLANSLFDNLFYVVPAGLLIWIILGLSQNPGLLKENNSEGMKQ